MKRKILDFSVMKEELSQNNVLEMAELIAFMELRFQIGYQGSRMQRMYADLYADIKHKNELGYYLSRQKKQHKTHLLFFDTINMYCIFS